MYLNRASGEVHGAVDPSGKDSFSALICPPALLSLIIKLEFAYLCIDMLCPQLQW